MDKKRRFIIEALKVSEDDVFLLVLGERNNVLPGGVWSSYHAIVGEESIMIYKVQSKGIFKKTYSLSDYKKEIKFSEFNSAEFGRHNGNLWLQTTINGSFLPFTSPKQYWISKAGQKLVKNINKNISIIDLNTYSKMIK